MSQTEESQSMPKSMRQKRILDAAREEPNASLDALAAQVPSATTEDVERVLDEYGDPAAESGANAQPAASTVTAADDGVETTSTSTATPTPELTEPSTDPACTDTSDEAAAETPTVDADLPMDEPDTDEPTESPEKDADSPSPSPSQSQSPSGSDTQYPSLDDLTDTQRTTLQAVHDTPGATQREIADQLGVTASTVCNRVNDLPGFNWTTRKGYVEAVFGADAGGGSTDPTTGPESAGNGGDDEATRTDDQTDPQTEAVSMEASDTHIAEISDRLSTIEQQVSALDDAEPQGAFDDPELVHKVVHACMESEAISKDEELRILKNLL